MLALRYLYVLALVIWLGGMLLLGAVIAPTTFEVLQHTSLLAALAPEAGRALAGELFGVILARFHYVTYVCAGVLLLTLAGMAIFGPRPRGFAVRVGLVAIMLATTLYSGLVVLRGVEAIQRDSGGVPSRLPAADIRRARFDALHLLSTRLMMVNIAGALGLLLFEAREHAR